MRTKLALSAVAVLALLALSAAPAGAAPSTTAPPNCKVLNPLFAWDAGQERALRASDNPCDAAPGRQAWLIFQRNGNLAFYLKGEQLWDSGTKGEGFRLVERGYGGLDIENREHGTIWGTGAPGASGFEPHPSGGFGVGFNADEDSESNALTHWDEGEGLCGPEGGCGEVLWISGEGTT